jgi:hypothetical protein
MGDSVIGVGNYVIAKALPLGNFMIADTSPSPGVCQVWARSCQV